MEVFSISIKDLHLFILFSFYSFYSFSDSYFF